MNRKRVRAYLVLLSVSLWSIWAIDISTSGPIDRLGKVKGTDFIHFYVIGSIARTGAWTELYDARAQYARTQTIVADPPIYLPVESPQTAVVLAPFARLPYTAAFLAWVAVLTAVYAGCCWLLLRDTALLKSHRYEAIAACAAFPGFFSLVLHGQTSIAALAAIAGALVAFRRNRRLIAGLALGCLVFKPHWLLAAGAVLLFVREWRALTGAALAALAQTAITALGVGAPVMRSYWQALRTLPQMSRLLEPRPGDSLKGFAQLVTPTQPVALALYLAAAAACLVAAASIWTRAAAVELRGSALLFAMMLVCPHVNTYDLVLLGPALLLLVEWLAQHADDPRTAVMRWLAIALFLAPLLNSLPAVVRVQFSVTAMMVVLALMRSVAMNAPPLRLEFLHGIVAPRAEWPITGSPSTSENASAATRARLLASPSTKSPSGSIAAG